MFVKQLQSDGGAYEGVHQDPALALVDQAIDTLDGKTSTSVTIAGADEEPWLCVGGGNDGRYVVVFQQDAMNHWVLEDQGINETGRVLIVCGFQAGDFPASQAVGKGIALAAAHTFALSGVRSEGLAWRFTGRK